VYRLIAANTADVFLNNNSFDKGAIMTAFAHSSEAISKFCSIHQGACSVYICLGKLFVQVEEISDTEDDDETPTTAKAKGKGKGKGKGKEKATPAPKKRRRATTRNSDDLHAPEPIDSAPGPSSSSKQTRKKSRRQRSPSHPPPPSPDPATRSESQGPNYKLLMEPEVLDFDFLLTQLNEVIRAIDGEPEWEDEMQDVIDARDTPVFVNSGIDVLRQYVQGLESSTNGELRERVNDILGEWVGHQALIQAQDPVTPTEPTEPIGASASPIPPPPSPRIPDDNASDSDVPDATLGLESLGVSSLSLL